MSPINLIWEDKKTLLINDVRFFVTWEPKELQQVESTADLFLLVKSRKMIERSVALGQQQTINKVFDIGIFKGGSAVLYDQIFQPEKIVAIEYHKKPVGALTQYIDRRGKNDAIKLFYGTNQADRSAMETILAAEFPGRDIDLVVDDASHLYKETKEAFNITFPYLKAGGRYIIEDWAWAHWPGEYWQTNPWHFWKPRPFRGRKAMSNLLTELFMLAASRRDLIENIFIDHDVIIVTKGQGDIPQGRFDIEDHYLLRGKTFRAPL